MKWKVTAICIITLPVLVRNNMKELFIEAHEELIEEYLEKHPEATEAEAYDKTADAACSRMSDKYANMIDRARDLRKEGR